MVQTSANSKILTLPDADILSHKQSFIIPNPKKKCNFIQITNTFWLSVKISTFTFVSKKQKSHTFSMPIKYETKIKLVQQKQKHKSQISSKNLSDLSTILTHKIINLVN